MTVTLLDLNGSTLSGRGTVTGALNNDGPVSPGLFSGELVVGNYLQQASARLEVEVGGVVAGTEHSRLSAQAVANLNGTLEVSLIDGYLPQGGEGFEIVAAETFTGDFSSYILPLIATDVQSMGVL